MPSPPEGPKIDVKAVRAELGLSQARFAELLGVSVRAVQSCEQGWRKPSDALEKTALLLLMAHRHGATLAKNVCWKAVRCDRVLREQCVAYMSRQGHLCWFLTGTLCKGLHLRSWRQKLQLCKDCAFFAQLLGEGPLPSVSK